MKLKGKPLASYFVEGDSPFRLRDLLFIFHDWKFGKQARQAIEQVRKESKDMWVKTNPIRYVEERQKTNLRGRGMYIEW